ncbi:MAG: NAD(P)-binding protein, partial [Acidobacteriaceae bacterium]
MKQGDKALGVGCPVQTGDLLDGRPLPVAYGVSHAEESVANAAWDGYSGIGDYAGANGNTHAAMRAGHGIRDEEYIGLLSSAAIEEEVFDCVIVGGGISGLAAAHVFTQKTEGRQRCLVLENHSVFGGEARRNEFIVDGQRLLAHQGSALFFPPLAGSFIEKFYRSIGFSGEPFSYQTWGGAGPDPSLSTSNYIEGGAKLGMFFGARFGHPEGLWLTDPWGKQLHGAPLPESMRQELLHAHNTPSTAALPRADGDAVARGLDQISMETWLMKSGGLSRETIRSYMPYAASGAGASADAISAYADYAPDLLFPWRQQEGSQMFPGGNTGIARLLIRALIPSALPGDASLHTLCLNRIQFDALDRPQQPVRVRMGATVVAVQHDGAPQTATTASVIYLKDGALRRICAKGV